MSRERGFLQPGSCRAVGSVTRPFGGALPAQRALDLEVVPTNMVVRPTQAQLLLGFEVVRSG